MDSKYDRQHHGNYDSISFSMWIYPRFCFLIWRPKCVMRTKQIEKRKWYGTKFGNKIVNFETEKWFEAKDEATEAYNPKSLLRQLNSFVS